MYSRKFGARLRGMLGKPRMTRISRMAPSLASDTDALQSDARSDAPGRVTAGSLTLWYPRYSGNPWLNSLRCSVKSCLDSRLLVFAKFLEARIIAERIEHRIEPEQRRSERHARSECATGRDREQFL